ncbi:hypothetical protein G6F57_016088 [Rhizopus arrhizus]|nr:hypothetical protein G6F57_016088 [Rhizopus arrhizus]
MPAAPRRLSFRRPSLPLGLPLALTSGTLQAWATVEGVPLQEIGFLTLVGTAYTIKFLWAPLVDRFVPPLLGRRRGWMLVTQLLLAVTIMAMGMLSPSAALMPLAMLAVLVAFLSATQDIAFDAYCTDVLRKEERGAGAAIKVMGYRLAMIASGGLALILADQWIGWGYTYVLMGGLMLLCSVATLLAPEPEHVARAPRSLRAAVGEPLQEFFTRRGALAVLLLIVLYKLGDAFAGALSTTFLIRGAGFTPTEVGTVNKVLGLAATIVGALAGRIESGVLADRDQPEELVADGDGRRHREPVRRAGHRVFRRIADGAVPPAVLGHAIRAAVSAVGGGPHLPGRTAHATAGRIHGLAGLFPADRVDRIARPGAAEGPARHD